MGKKSVRENKTPYQLAREEAGLTREAAAEKLYTSPDRLVRIEGAALPRPEEVIAMAEAYRARPCATITARSSARSGRSTCRRSTSRTFRRSCWKRCRR